MRRSLQVTYRKLSEALGEPTALSMRKQVCLQFLKWASSTRREDKEAFVEVIKRWRKEDNKIGQHRTLLERKARKLFRKVTVRKNRAGAREAAREHGLMQKEQGIGIHDPAVLAERRREIALNAVKVRQEKNAHSSMMDWLVHNVATGETQKITNLRKFCRDNDLDMRHAWRAVKTGGTHKGWKIERYLKEWDEL